MMETAEVKELNPGTLRGRAEELAQAVVRELIQKQYTLALAESCTAGLVSDLAARISGASAILWGSFVCYSADAKQRMLGIDSAFLNEFGLVSGETARKMAVRALEISGVMIAAAVTGLAGPLGDGSDTPIGTVWIAIAASAGQTESAAEPICLHFTGTRAEIRIQAAIAVLEKIRETVNR